MRAELRRNDGTDVTRQEADTIDRDVSRPEAYRVRWLDAGLNDSSRRNDPITHCASATRTVMLRAADPQHQVQPLRTRSASSAEHRLFLPSSLAAIGSRADACRHRAKNEPPTAFERASTESLLNSRAAIVKEKISDQMSAAPAANAKGGLDQKAPEKQSKAYRAKIPVLDTALPAKEPHDASWFDSGVLAPMEAAVESATALAGGDLSDADADRIAASINAAMKHWDTWGHLRDEDGYRHRHQLARLDVDPAKEERVRNALDRLDQLSAQVPRLAWVLGDWHDKGFPLRPKNPARALDLWLRAIDADCPEAISSLWPKAWTEDFERVRIVLQGAIDRESVLKRIAKYLLSPAAANAAKEPQDASWFDSGVLAPIEAAVESATALASGDESGAEADQIATSIDAAMKYWDTWAHPRDEDEYLHRHELARLNVDSAKEERVRNALDRLDQLSVQVPRLAWVLGNRHEKGFPQQPKNLARALDLWLRAIDADCQEAISRLGKQEWGADFDRVRVVLQGAIDRGSVLAPIAAALLLPKLRWPCDEFDQRKLNSLLNLVRTDEALRADLRSTVALEEQSGIFATPIANFDDDGIGIQHLAIATLIGLFPDTPTDEARLKARSTLDRAAELARNDPKRLSHFGFSTLAQLIIYGCPVNSTTKEAINGIINWLHPVFDEDSAQSQEYSIPKLQGAIRHVARINSPDPVPLVNFISDERVWRKITDEIESLANLQDSDSYWFQRRMLLCAWLWSSMQNRHCLSAAEKMVEIFGPGGTAGLSIRPRWVYRCLVDLRSTLEGEPDGAEDGNLKQEKLARVGALIGEVHLADPEPVAALLSAIEEYTRALSSARHGSTKRNIASSLKRIAIALGSGGPADSPPSRIQKEAPELVRRECFDPMHGKGRLLNAVCADVRAFYPDLADKWMNSASIAAVRGLRDVAFSEPKYQSAAQFSAIVELAELLRMRSRPDEAAQLLIDAAESAIAVVREFFCQSTNERGAADLKWLLQPHSRLFELICQASDVLRLGDGIARDEPRSAAILGCFDATMRMKFDVSEIDKSNPDFAVRMALFTGLELLAQQSIADSLGPTRAQMLENLNRMRAARPQPDPEFHLDDLFCDIEASEDSPEDDEREARKEAVKQRTRSAIAVLNGGVEEIDVSEWRTRILSILIEHWDIRPRLHSEDMVLLRRRCHGQNIAPLSAIVNHLMRGKDSSALIAELLPQSYERESNDIYLRCVVAAGIASDDNATLDNDTVSKVIAALDEVIHKPSKRDLGRSVEGSGLPDRLLERMSWEFKTRIQSAREKERERNLREREQLQEQVEQTRRDWVSYLTHTVGNAITSVRVNARMCLDIVSNPGEDRALDQREAIRFLGGLISDSQYIQSLVRSYNDLAAGPQRLQQLWLEDSAGTITISDVVSEAVLHVLVHLLLGREEFEMLELRDDAVEPSRKAVLRCASGSSRLEVSRLVTEKFCFVKMELLAAGAVRMRRDGTRHTLLRALTSELILNAIKYHDPGTEVQVVVDDAVDAEVFRVVNQCKGAPRRSSSQRGLSFVQRACEDLSPLLSFRQSASDSSHSVELYVSTSGVEIASQ